CSSDLDVLLLRPGLQEPLRGGARLMRLENSFEVPAPPEAAWELLVCMPRVTPCMPGAKLDETVDDSNWKATVQVKLGPISLSFATDVKREEADAAGRRAGQGARGGGGRGKRGALATAPGLRVSATKDGRCRAGDVPPQLVTSFAECLQAQLT